LKTFCQSVHITRASGQQKRLWENCVQQFCDLCKAGAFPGPKQGMRNLNTKRGVIIINVKVYKAFDLRAFSGLHKEFLNSRMSLKLQENTGAV
jgi:hypothetical protein